MIMRMQEEDARKKKNAGRLGMFVPTASSHRRAHQHLPHQHTNELPDGNMSHRHEDDAAEGDRV